MSLAVLGRAAPWSACWAPEVCVEVHSDNGLPAFTLVRAARRGGPRGPRPGPRRPANRSVRIPQRRITVNLAPADLPKEGGCFDLPIALGILAPPGKSPPTSSAPSNSPANCRSPANCVRCAAPSPWPVRPPSSGRTADPAHRQRRRSRAGEPASRSCRQPACSRSSPTCAATPSSHPMSPPRRQPRSIPILPT